LTACPDAAMSCIIDHFRRNPSSSGAAGQVTIDSNRGPRRPLGIKEIRNGKFEWVRRKVEL